RIRVEGDGSRLAASAAGARARVDLLGSVPLRCAVTDRFSVPAVNWRGKSQGGQELEYPDDQSHFTAVSGSETAVMRFLAVIQVRRAGDPGDFTEVAPEAEGWVRAGGWRVRAQLDASKRPSLEVRSADGTVGVVTGRTSLTADGKVFEAKLPG